MAFSTTFKTALSKQKAALAAGQAARENAPAPIVPKITVGVVINGELVQVPIEEQAAKKVIAEQVKRNQERKPAAGIPKIPLQGIAQEDLFGSGKARNFATFAPIVIFGSALVLILILKK